MFDQIFKSKCNKKRLKVIFMIMSELRECESKHIIDYNHIYIPCTRDDSFSIFVYLIFSIDLAGSSILEGSSFWLVMLIMFIAYSFNYNRIIAG